MDAVLGLLNWTFLGDVFLRLVLAFLLALPLGWQREMTSIIGLRTFPLVAVASCGYILVSAEILGAHPDAQSRVLAGLMTGMGFIGGGAILKGNGSVRGTATAAGLWAMGVVGASVAYDNYEIALGVSFLGFLLFTTLTYLENRTGFRDPPEEDEIEAAD